MALLLPQSHVVKPVIPLLHVTVTIEIPIVPTMFSPVTDKNVFPVLLTSGLFRPPRCLILGAIQYIDSGENKDVITAITKNGIYKFGLNTTNSPEPEDTTAQWYILACKVNVGYFLIALRSNIESAYIGYSSTSAGEAYWCKVG